MKKIHLDLDCYFQRQFRISIFSKKFRIMIYIMDNPGCSLKDSQAESGLSQRGFQMTIKEMLDADLITLDDDLSDGRRKRMNIGPGGRLAEELFQTSILGCSPLANRAPTHQTTLSAE